MTNESCCSFLLLTWRTPPARREPPPRLSLLLGLLVAGCPCGESFAATPVNARALETALDKYVALPDPVYAWNAVTNTRIEGVTVTVIDLTSQSWLTTNEVNRTLWRHWLIVARPDDLAHSTALLMIGGGNNKDHKLPKPSGELVQVAKHTRSVAAELRMVPNQPLIFGQDGRERVEDDLIAYTWDKYLRTGDERWPARLPMTKSAVRAMDTVTAFCASAAGGGPRSTPSSWRADRSGAGPPGRRPSSTSGSWPSARL